MRFIRTLGIGYDSEERLNDLQMQIAALTTQLGQLNAKLASLCPNDGTGKLTDTFLFTHGETWRVYFINDICATGFLELTGADNGGFKYIKVTSKFHNANGTILKQNMTIKSEINGSTQLGLYYPLGNGITQIYANQYGIRSNYQNQSGGAYNGVSGNEFHFANAHSVKCIKIS